MKVSIIGGGGRVGSTAAYALQLGGSAHELVLVDVAKDLASGEALDLLHGNAYSNSISIYAGDYPDIAGSDIVIITAGLRRKPDESRLELINRNVILFTEILKSVKEQRLAPDGKLLVVSNPVDVLTYLAVKGSGLPADRVIGLGTTLDTCRFRSLLGQAFKVPATSVNALILGEHGDSMVPLLSSMDIAGIPVASYPDYSEAKLNDVFEQTRAGGAEVIRLKGGAGYSVGVAIRAVVDAIAMNANDVLPVSSYQTGALGIKDVCLSLPTALSRKGVAYVLEPKCSDSEATALVKSAEVLKGTIQQVLTAN